MFLFFKKYGNRRYLQWQAAHKDKDGVQMLFPSKSGGKEYYLSDADNINEGKFITTDQNNAEKKTEGNLAFWKVSGKDVHYSDQSIGKTIRVNINAGGGLDGHQQNTWEDNPRYIWTNKDSKNAEFTYYIRCSGTQASCCELILRVGEGNASLNYNFEYNHPDYVNDEDGIKKLQANNDTEIGKWFGRKTIVWTNSDGKSVTARDYIDLDPFSANGKPKNNWKPLQEKVFRTISRETEDGKKYNVPPLWGGMFTSRVDGFQTVDYAIVSLREIKRLI